MSWCAKFASNGLSGQSTWSRSGSQLPRSSIFKFTVPLIKQSCCRVTGVGCTSPSTLRQSSITTEIAANTCEAETEWLARVPVGAVSTVVIGRDPKKEGILWVKLWRLIVGNPIISANRLSKTDDFKFSITSGFRERSLKNVTSKLKMPYVLAKLPEHAKLTTSSVT